MEFFFARSFDEICDFLEQTIVEICDFFQKSIREKCRLILFSLDPEFTFFSSPFKEIHLILSNSRKKKNLLVYCKIKEINCRRITSLRKNGRRKTHTALFYHAGFSCFVRGSCYSACYCKSYPSLTLLFPKNLFETAIKYLRVGIRDVNTCRNTFVSWLPSIMRVLC